MERIQKGRMARPGIRRDLRLRQLRLPLPPVHYHVLSRYASAHETALRVDQ